MKTIVLAWTETESVVVKQGRIDLGERHTFREVTVGKAAMWLNEGTEEDEEKAAAYAGQTGGYVFLYPVTEKDPLGRARKEVLLAK